jgi:hypothetical protein
MGQLQAPMSFSFAPPLPLISFGDWACDEDRESHGSNRHEATDDPDWHS